MHPLTRPAPLLAASLAFSACAPAPSGAQVEVGPIEATTLDDLSVKITDQASSARADAEIIYEYSWYVGDAAAQSIADQLVTDLSESTVPAERTRKGQRWRVDVRPFDGKQYGRMTSASTTVVNSLPEVYVSVSDNTPISTEAVRASVEFFDADNDPVALTYEWLKNGRIVPEIKGTDLLPAFTRRGEIWRVRVSGHDGEAQGFPDYQDIQIQNGTPVVTLVEILPELPYTLDDIVASVEHIEPDLDPVTYNYTWFVDGVALPAVRGPVFPADRTVRNQVIQVEVTASDDELTSEPLRSNSVTVLNTPPGAPRIAITPGAPIPGATLQCLVTRAPDDPDRDSFTYAFAWTRNGAGWTGATATSIHPGDTISSTNVSLDDVWSCSVVANDGMDDGPAATAQVVIEPWSGTRVFTNCGASGNQGPDQERCDRVYGRSTLARDGVIVREGIQEWTAPAAGRYRIVAYGAQGGTPNASWSGGRGAMIAGSFDLTSGQKVFIAVGQQGGAISCYGGGGGASWVMDAEDEPLLIAAGGGGGRSTISNDACPGLTGQYGSRGSGTSNFANCSIKNTDLGLGGIMSSTNWGGGGAGLNGDGAGQGGKSWDEGVLGGGSSSFGEGGFGGGGGGGSSCGGGGGGGYSGGDAGAVGGGGGSINTGFSQSNSSGVRTGNGVVEIDLL